MADKILVTGGLGYIGSHCVVALCEAGFEPVIVDNHSNARASVLERLERLTGRSLTCYDLDIRNRAGLETLLQREPCSGLIHLAAFKAVGESVARPLMYYDNNVGGSVSLFAPSRPPVAARSSFHRRPRSTAMSTPNPFMRRCRCSPPTPMARPRR